ncbi:Hypothetical protein Ccan_21240 [Capnocytophaga canimorsus Cc5]|uniref:Uncharacterized protein n=2 Tax=Flavobacteriaceae TaxID=49546 RepID=F9YUK3_CAPCC|nr:Hypothetical protein Ccan_21240 [Capnocytophaga canimorsus Cc5]
MKSVGYKMNLVEHKMRLVEHKIKLVQYNMKCVQSKMKQKTINNFNIKEKMKQKILFIILCANIFASCENVNQLVNNISNEISESSERIETEISKSTNQIKDEVLKNVNLEAITNELLNVKHLESIENVALKVVEYQNIAERISLLQENITGGELGALEILAITQFTKNAQQELIKLKEGNTSIETKKKIDSLLINYENVLNNYSQQNIRGNSEFNNRFQEDMEEDEDFDN